MVTIEFNYNQSITAIQAKLTDLFQEAIDKFYQKSLIPKDSVYFRANEIIKPERTVETYMNDINKADCKLIVYVEDIYKVEENIKKESKDIICPECKEPCLIKIEDYHIKLYECKNGHTTKGIKIDEYPKTQEVNMSSIICEKCKIQNKGKLDKFYYCFILKLYHDYYFLIQ